jgi:hypothetical protein
MAYQQWQRQRHIGENSGSVNMWRSSNGVMREMCNVVTKNGDKRKRKAKKKNNRRKIAKAKKWQHENRKYGEKLSWRNGSNGIWQKMSLKRKRIMAVAKPSWRRW